MTVTNFKEARQQNAQVGPFLNTSHFAEQVTVRPPSGQDRTITAKVTLEEAALDESGQVVETEQELIWVKVLRDESATKGGIGEPAEGYMLWRAADQQDEAWSYQGRRRYETPHSWELLFGRVRPTRYRRR